MRHNSGIEKSTRPYAPWKAVCHVVKNTRGEAMVLEKKLKNLNTSGLKKFIEKYGLSSNS